MPLYYTVNDKEARQLLFDIRDRSKDYQRLYKQAVIPTVKKEIDNNLNKQKTPAGVDFPQSKLAMREDRLGFTLIRKTNSNYLKKDMQSDSNYVVSGNTLNVNTSVTDKKGFLYGARLNAWKGGQWRFAGVSVTGFKKIVRDLMGIILHNKQPSS